jgi:hypothetical protein
MKKAMVVVLLLVGTVMCFAQFGLQEMDPGVVGTWKYTDADGTGVVKFNANGTASMTYMDGTIVEGQWFTQDGTLISFIAQRHNQPGKDWVNGDAGSKLVQQYVASDYSGTLNWIGIDWKKQ